MVAETMDARKASSYKNEKINKWQQDVQEQGRSDQSEACGYCGRSPKHAKNNCPAKDKTCKKCGMKGHFQAVCRSQPQRDQRESGGHSQSQPPGGAAKPVRIGNVPVARVTKNLPVLENVEDDAETTPLMKDVTITPRVGKTFKYDVFPGTGCYQSIMLLDLVTKYGLKVDKNKKKRLRTINGLTMKCCGAVSIEVAFEGRKTGILALITPSLKNEILLSWMTLQRMGIIPEVFPHVAEDVQIRAVRSPDEKLATSQSLRLGTSSKL